MMLSMALAGIASQYWDPRTIGAIAGALEFHHRDILGLGALHRPAPRARPKASSPRRSKSMESQPIEFA